MYFFVVVQVVFHFWQHLILKGWLWNVPSQKLKDESKTIIWDTSVQYPHFHRIFFTAWVWSRFGDFFFFGMLLFFKARNGIIFLTGLSSPSEAMMKSQTQLHLTLYFPQISSSPAELDWQNYSFYSIRPIPNSEYSQSNIGLFDDVPLYLTYMDYFLILYQICLWMI